MRGYKEKSCVNNTSIELAINKQTDHFSLAIDAINRFQCFSGFSLRGLEEI